MPWKFIQRGKSKNGSSDKLILFIFLYDTVKHFFSHDYVIFVSFVNPLLHKIKILVEIYKATCIVSVSRKSVNLLYHEMLQNHDFTKMS